MINASVLMFFGLIGLCSDARAGRIEDIEKRIEKLERLQNKKIPAGYEDGDFFIRSADGNYKLVPGIALQFQHRVQVIEDAADKNGFFLRRGRVKLEGNIITRELEYEVEFDLGTPDPGDPQFDLKDLYFDYRLTGPVRIKIGQYKVPFGFQELTSSKKQQFVERSLASEEFTAGRDIGVMLWGPDEEDFFEYYAGAFNGDGDNNFNKNNEFMYAARFVLTPLGRYKEGESDIKGSAAPGLTLGVEGFYNKDVTAGDNLFVLGGFTGFKFAGASIRAEYFNRINRDDASTDVSDLDAHGFYSQAGYFLLPEKFEIAMRLSQIFRKGDDNDEREYSGVLNWFFKGHRAKLQIGYTLLIDEDAISGADNEERHIVRTQFQLYF